MKQSSKKSYWLLCLIFFSCNYELVTFKTYNDSTHQKHTYKIKIPTGYTLKKMSFESENVDVYEYADSARIYLSDNLYPSAFYTQAYKKYGENLSFKFFVDSFAIDGIDSAGMFWETRKIKNIVYGYTQVPIEKKRFFDSILNGIAMK